MNSLFDLILAAGLIVSAIGHIIQHRRVTALERDTHRHVVTSAGMLRVGVQAQAVSLDFVPPKPAGTHVASQPGAGYWQGPDL